MNISQIKMNYISLPFLLITAVICLMLANCDTNNITAPPDSGIPPIDSMYTIKVMTYNILNGGGYISDFEPWAADFGYPGNRLPEILDVIRTIDPDILGIQEAAGWHWGEPSVADSVAQVLGMNYFLAPCDDPEFGFNDVVLFTKFRIVNAVDFPGSFWLASLMARLIDNNGMPIKVFVTHVKREMGLSHIYNKIGPNGDTLSIIMGDMNCNAALFESYNPGWKLVSEAVSAYRRYIDQIWVSEISNSLGENIPLKSFYPSMSPLLPLSDHLPQVAKVTFYPAVE